MTEKEARQRIAGMPINSRLQLIMKNGTIQDVMLASHDTGGTNEKVYDNLTVPALPPAIIVTGKRWGTYRINTEDIVSIARVG